jgi:subtilisin family serine protease
VLGGISRHREHTGIVAIAATVVLGLVAAPAAADGVPDFRPEQWGLQSIGAQELWPETQGQGITVALPGISVHTDHPDLVDKMVTDNPADPTYPGGWMEFDANGNLVASEPHDSSDHGTHVSGTVYSVIAVAILLGLVVLAARLPAITVARDDKFDYREPDPDDGEGAP